MLLALDSTGQSYLTLTQSNSNSSIMELFVRGLVKKLDAQDVNWRDYMVFLLDNAPYHTSNDTLETMKSLNVPLLFFGPHSYDAAPCELWYGWFKTADINPNRISQNAR